MLAKLHEEEANREAAEKAAQIAAEHAAAERATEIAAQAAAAAQAAQQAAAPPPTPAPSNDLGGAFALLRQCESTNNYATDTGNGFYGAYQFDLTTWANYGGYEYPSDAPPAVQDAKAQQVQAERGWEPWPACSAKLGL